MSPNLMNNYVTSRLLAWWRRRTRTRLEIVLKSGSFLAFPLSTGTKVTNTSRLQFKMLNVISF